jgi:hypothetical protein
MIKRRRGGVVGKENENRKEGGESLEYVVVDAFAAAIVVSFDVANAFEGNTKENTKEKNAKVLPLPFAHPFHVVAVVEEGI